MSSMREVIMDGVFDAPGSLTTNELFEAIKDKRPMGMIDVVGQLWGLQKTGELTFKERKGQATGDRGHHGGDLTDIHLTPFGERNVRKRRGLEAEPPSYDRPFVKVTMADVLAGTGMTPIEPPEREKVEITERLTTWKEPPAEKVVAAQILAEGAGMRITEERHEPRIERRGYGVRMSHPYSTVTDQGRHPVGKDMTDARRHGYKAKGGPVTRTRVAPEPVADQVAAELPQAELMEAQGSAEARRTVGNSVSPSPMRDLEFRFPLIWRIITREDKTASAARLLEEAGLDDMAIQVMEQVSFSDLEKEVIELIKELGR